MKGMNMIFFAILANALMIISALSGSIPFMAAAFVLFLVFVVRGKKTAPESVFNLQRLVLIISAIICVVLLFTRRPLNNKLLFSAAMIAGGLYVLRNYYLDD